MSDHPCPLPEKYANLPATARMLIAHLGEELAFKVLAAWGGLQIRIPMGACNSALGARMEALFGVAGAASIIEHFGGEIISIPVCKQAVRDIRDAAIIRDYGQGETIQALALREGLTTRMIEKILKRTPGQAHSVRRSVPFVPEGQGSLDF